MDAEDDYTEIVLTFDADFSDPDLHLQLVSLSGQLQQHLPGDQNVTVTKVEPWNSVRVTLSISKDAAVKLQRLAEEDGQLLRDLGILSVQLHGSQSVYVGDSSHDGMAVETAGKQFLDTSGVETRATCTSEPLGARRGQRPQRPLTSWQSFAGRQEGNNMVMPQDCFRDGSQSAETFTYTPGIQSVEDMSGCSYVMSPHSESAAYYADNPDARFGLSNNRLARSFHPISGGAFDDVFRTRSVSQYCFSESKQSNKEILLPGRQSTSFALCANQPMTVDHAMHHSLSRLKSGSAQNTFSMLLQNCGSKDLGIAFSNCDSLFHRQWSYPTVGSLAAQRQSLKAAVETTPRDRETDFQRHKEIVPWWRGLGQESKEIKTGSKLAKSHDRRRQSLSSDWSSTSPVTDNYAFAQQKMFQNIPYSIESDQQSDLRNNQINSVPLNCLEKSHASSLCQMPFPVKPSINHRDSGSQWATDKQNGTTVQSESRGMSLREMHSPDMSDFSPASPENSCNPEDGMFCDSATILAAESSKLAVERALSLLSDVTDEASDMPMEKKDHHSSHFDLSSSLPSSSSSHQRILGKIQANSLESDCSKTRTHPETSVALNRTTGFNHVVEFPRKSPSALKQTSRFARSVRRVPRVNNVNADLNYFLESKSKTYDGYSCKGSMSKLSNAATSASTKAAIHSNCVSRNASTYVEGDRKCGAAIYSSSNNSSREASIFSSTVPDPIEQDTAKVSHNPFILPHDHFALSSKSPNFNFTRSSLSVGSHLTTLSSTFPSMITAAHDSLVRFSCRAQSQDKPRTTHLEGAMTSSSPRNTCSWLESDLCGSIPDSGIASNTSSGGSSDLSELERTLGGSLENFSRYQEAAEVKDGSLPDGSLEDGTDVRAGGWQVHSAVSLVRNANPRTAKSHESLPALEVCQQTRSPGRAVNMVNSESYTAMSDESMASVVQLNQDEGFPSSQHSETLKKRAPGVLEEHPSKDISVQLPISKVSSMKTNAGLAAAYQNSRFRPRHAQQTTIRESSSKNSFEPLITCPSLPHRLSESVKLVMQGVSPVGTSSDAFATCGTPAPLEAMQASTVIRITKTKSGDIHTKKKDTWCIQPVIRCPKEKQSDEKRTSSENSEMPPTPCSVENAKSSTSETATLQSSNLNSLSQRTASSRNKLCNVRLKPGKKLISANSLKAKKIETSRLVGADRHKLVQRSNWRVAPFSTSGRESCSKL